MHATTGPNDTTFEDDLQARLADLKKRAEAVGQTMTAVCRNTGVARATYERWLARAPQSVMILDQMRAEVMDMEAKFKAQMAQVDAAGK